MELDEKLIVKSLQSQEWQQLMQYLDKKFKISINADTRKPNPLPVTEPVVTTLSKLLKELCENFTNSANTDVSAVLKIVFKTLRNCVVCNPVAQDLLVKDPFILINTHEIATVLLSSNAEGGEDCVVMVVQFLSNLTAKNPNNALKVWTKFSEIILKLYKKPKYRYHTAALLYNILCQNNDLIPLCKDVYEYVVGLCASGDANEYHAFTLERLVQNYDFFSSYPTFKPSNRMAVLAFIIECGIINKEASFPDPKVLLELAAEFKKKSDSILKTEASYVDEIEPEEVVALLEALAKLSASEHHCKHLQSDKSLLINCAFLLMSIHSIGKESQNNFTAIPKLSEVTSTNDSITTDPTFGFKAHLIRLLGNLCWKHRVNQDEVRELDCIPLLLDCCNIDARNPFIIQWCILALRNLCENNRQNQTVIADMNQQGVVDSATLQQMGLMLHDDGTNKIGIVPLDSIRK